MKKNVQKHYDNLEKKFNRQYQRKLDKEQKNKSKADGPKQKQTTDENEPTGK